MTREQLREQLADYVPSTRDVLHRAGLDYRRTTGTLALELCSAFALGLLVGAVAAFAMSNERKSEGRARGGASSRAHGPRPKGAGDDDSSRFGPPVSQPASETNTPMP